MNSRKTPTFRWQLNYKILIFAAVFFPVTVLAGFWQLSRADEKRIMLEEQSIRSQLAPAPITELDTKAEQNYRPVRVSGHWLPEYFLLENRVKNGRPGYEVLGVLETDGNWVLVNRGWVEASYDRQVLPEVSFELSAPVQLAGYAYHSKSAPFTLGEQIWTGSWPERIQSVDWDAMQARLEHPLFPYLVRLDTDSEAALSTGWPIVNLTPQRHVAYAMQWFALALALVILTIFASSNLGSLIKKQPDISQ